MKFLNLIKYNLKRMIKNKVSFILTLILPMVVLLGIGGIMNKTSNDSRVYYIVNNDRGTYGSELVKELSDDFNIKVIPEDIAAERLRKKVIAEFYEIGGSFSDTLKRGENVTLTVNRREKSTYFSDFEMKARDYIDGLMFQAMVRESSGQELALDTLKSGQVKIIVNTEKKTSVGSQVIINLMISFNLFCAIGMCYEIFGQKSERTLRRALTTGNRPSAVIGAMFMAQFLLVFLGYVLLLLMYVFLIDKTMIPQIPIIMFTLMMTTALELSLAVFVSRIIKTDKLISVVMQIILCTTCFLGGAFVPIEYLPKSISFISKFMPQYWAVQSIRQGRFELSLIVLLFAVLLFTAGTVSTRSFAEQ